MNTKIRRLAMGLLVCYLALFVQLNVVQVLRADDYNAQIDRTEKRRFTAPARRHSSSGNTR